MAGRHNFSGKPSAYRQLYDHRQPERQPTAVLEMWKGMAEHQIKSSEKLAQLAAAEYPSIEEEIAAYSQAVIAWQMLISLHNNSIANSEGSV